MYRMRRGDATDKERFALQDYGSQHRDSQGPPSASVWELCHYLIEDGVLARVDEILASSNGPAELQIIAYGADSPAHEGVPALPR